MAVLSIAVADIKRLCAIPSTDTNQDGDVAALIAAEQVALEYSLDPAVLIAAQEVTAGIGVGVPPVPTNPGLVATLSLGVAEMMAGSYLVQLARSPAFTDDLVLVSSALGTAPVVTVSLAAVKQLCMITDTSQDADITALMTLEQPALEYALDPAVLAASIIDPRLLAVLTLGLTERMAGSYLEQQLRQPGYTDDFHIGGLDISASRTDNLVQLAVRLSEQGQARLLPYEFVSRQAIRQKRAQNADVLDVRGTKLYDRGLKRIEPFKVAARRVVDEAVKGLDGGVGDASSKIPLLASVASGRSVFD
jgi:hypothetical protein